MANVPTKEHKQALTDFIERALDIGIEELKLRLGTMEVRRVDSSNIQIMVRSPQWSGPQFYLVKVSAPI